MPISRPSLLHIILMSSLVCSTHSSLAAEATKKDFPPAYFTNSFTNNGHTCSIHLKKTFTTSLNDFSEKLEYSVYCDNKFLHPDTYEGGTVIGCRTAYSTPKSYNPIAPLLLNGKQSGWWIVTGDSCGAAHTASKQAIVYPNTESPDEGYHQEVFTSNFLGVDARPDPTNKGIEVWYARYAWCGSMAESIPVAHIKVIPKSRFLHSIPNKLPSHFADWPKDFKPDYQQAFLAGMANQNIEVLESAKILLSKETFSSKNGCFVDGLPRTSKQLDEIISTLKILENKHVSKYLKEENNVDGNA
jgi:hypothetical protein